jgi:hypothetical protein
MRRLGAGQGNHGPASALRGLERRQCLEDMVDDYVSWREACALVSAAYSDWKGAGRQDQELAFSEYVAALNCEEDAAMAYQRAVERVAATNARATR